MAVRYRVILQKKTLVQAMFAGKLYTDWYVAQTKWLFGWKKLGVYPTREEAEAACSQHAGGELIDCNTRIVSEFERRDE